ncbi:hypothetical protein [Sphingomonas sp.]|jgi:hypothetical protein|uniref:8-oxoguanine DNA glycosylase OGG fold protein n=1 Tax=Sphingomonas sp. TaxID=28214 RepID=UPI002ED82A1D
MLPLAPISILPVLRELSPDSLGERFRPTAWKKHSLPYVDELTERFSRNEFTRADVKQAFREDVRKGVVFSLVWGFPNGFINPKRPADLRNAWPHIDKLVDKVRSLQGRPGDCTPTEIIKALNTPISGIATSSTSKIAYFAGIQATSGRCLIYDSQVIKAIVSETFAELYSLRIQLVRQRDETLPFGKKVQSVNQVTTYLDYISGINSLCRKLERRFEPDQVEEVLFAAGRAIKIPEIDGDGEEV